MMTVYLGKCNNWYQVYKPAGIKAFWQLICCLHSLEFEFELMFNDTWCQYGYSEPCLTVYSFLVGRQPGDWRQPLKLLSGEHVCSLNILTLLPDVSFQAKADVPIEVNPSSDRRAATFASNPAKILRWSADRSLIRHLSAGAPANLTRS